MTQQHLYKTLHSNRICKKYQRLKVVNNGPLVWLQRYCEKFSINQLLHIDETAMRDFEKLHVACELLQQALRLYFEGEAYFASLHLAGAADEALGKYVEFSGGVSSFESLRTGAVKIATHLFPDEPPSEPKEIAELMNHAKNNTKHGRGKINFDARKEAYDMLDRAVTNYYLLMGNHPLEEIDIIRRFNHERKNI